MVHRVRFLLASVRRGVGVDHRVDRLRPILGHSAAVDLQRHDDSQEGVAVDLRRVARRFRSLSSAGFSLQLVDGNFPFFILFLRILREPDYLRFYLGAE